VAWLKRRDLVRKVRRFGGTEESRRGKGSHRLLRRPDPERRGRTLTACLPYHGDNVDVPTSHVNAIRRKLKMTPLHGVSDADWDAA
jgi:hypothetical protein